jgi:serine/threonine protein kinase/Tfp pilus assembly protein PilF
MAGMSRERWEAVSPHLDRALELAREHRKELLDSLRAARPEVAADLETLLALYGLPDSAGFLENAPEFPEATLAGQVVGAYTLVSSIGQGGMGSVWLARRSDGRFEGQAAVKLLNASLVGRAGEERFRREGSILARLAHPHIARLIDAGVSAAGQPYLVLEHVDGEPIDRYCDHRKLDVEARLRLFLDVLAAVAHAHANLIVHRDIKPSNVLVDTDGQVKLLDFGIAKLLEGEGIGGVATALTREGGSALTPEYAAPEQVTGGAVTTATDVYALGTLLYELLTGRHPAESALGSTADLVRAIVDTEPQRLSDSVTRPAQTRERNAAARGTTPEGLRRALKGDLDVIVARTLKKPPEERYASVTALADDIGRYLNDQPIGARRDTLAYRTAKFVRRHTAGLAAAAAVALLLAALVGFYTVRLARERDRARLQAQRATKASEFLSDLLTEADPYEKKEPTVRDLLDAGAARVHKELAGQPELETEMLTVIARVYHHLDLDQKAQPLLEESVAIGRRAIGPESEQVADALNNLGMLLRDRGDLAAAEKALTESLALRRRLYGDEHKDLAVTLVELAAVYSDQGFDDRAEPLLKESLSIRRKVLGPEDHETGVSMNEIALLKRRQGDLAGAESLFRQTLPIFQKTMGKSHPHVASLLNNLALVAADRNEFAESENLLRQSLGIDREKLGERNPSVGNTWINLARPLLEQRKYDEAAAAARQGLEITRVSVGNDHPRIAYGEIYLARVYLARRQPAAAEPLLRDALRIRRVTFPPDDWRVGVSESVLGAALTALGRYDEAETLLRHAQRVLKDVPGAQGQEAKATAARLAALDEARRRPQAAALNRPAPAPR